MRRLSGAAQEAPAVAFLVQLVAEGRAAVHAGEALVLLHALASQGAALGMQVLPLLRCLTRARHAHWRGMQYSHWEPAAATELPCLPPASLPRESNMCLPASLLAHLR